jgi:hypothetical protein
MATSTPAKESRNFMIQEMDNGSKNKAGHRLAQLPAFGRTVG